LNCEHDSGIRRFRLIPSWLPPRLARFHAAYPGIELAVAIGNTAEAARAVAEGAAEIGFVWRRRDRRRAALACSAAWCSGATASGGWRWRR